MASCCIALAGVTLLLRLSERRARERLIAEAVSGSVLASVGFSALLGYAFRLPAVYDWGTNTAMAAVTAAALLATGSALLVLAWRESLKADGRSARLAAHARRHRQPHPHAHFLDRAEGERGDLSRREGVDRRRASSRRRIKSDIDQQTNALDRLARNGADSPDNNPAGMG
jgi:hypothetical protein